jgi:hypothetical protein
LSHVSDSQRENATKGIDYSELPEHLRGGMERYLEQGLPPGAFLQHVIANDLREACGRAAAVGSLTVRLLLGEEEAVEVNTAVRGALLIKTVTWLTMHAPAQSWGSDGALFYWTSQEHIGSIQVQSLRLIVEEEIAKR